MGLQNASDDTVQ